MGAYFRNLRALAVATGLPLAEIIRRRLSTHTGNAVVYVDAHHTIRLSRPESATYPDVWERRITMDLEPLS